MSGRFLSSGERKKFLNEFKERFGLPSVPVILIESGKEKVRAFSGTLSRDELVALGTFARVEFVGLYFGKEDFGFRFSFDATQIIGPKLTEHVLDINEEQFNLWMRGHELPIEVESGVHVVRYNGDYLGCGFSNGKKLLNYVPRERQLKRV